MGLQVLIVLVICLFFLLSGCAKAGNANERWLVQANSSQCFSKDFSGFFVHFSNSTEVQKSSTHFPLEKLHIDIDAEPEPAPVVESLDASKVNFPVFPAEAERRAKGLVIRVDEQDVQHARVVLTKEDTDYQVLYFFQKNMCWALVRMEDWSL